MAKLGLSLNEAKTSVKNARAESFDFLGYTLGPTFARCRTEIPGRESFPEKRATHQGQDRRSPEARREGLVAERARQTEPPAGGLVGVLQLWNPRVGLSGRRSPCQRERSPLPRQTTQGARARRAPVFLERNPRKIRRDPTRSAPKARRRGPAMKSVGKPDAGNPHVRFDERGTGNGAIGQASSHRALPRLYNPNVTVIKLGRSPNKSSCTNSDMGPVWDLVEITSRSLRVSEPK